MQVNLWAREENSQACRARIGTGKNVDPLDTEQGHCYAYSMVEERRSTPRIRAYRPVRLYKPSSPHVTETLTKDLGIGGFRCISATLFPVSTELNLDLVLSSGDQPLTTRGKTVWFQSIPQSEQFDLGIAFLELSPQDKRRLSAYLDRLASQSVSARL